MIYDIKNRSIVDIYKNKRNIVDNTEIIVFYSKIPIISIILRYLYNKTLLPYFYWFFWRPAFHLYLFLFCLLVYSIREKDYKYLIIGCPILFQSFILFIINLSHEFRFQYSVYLVGTLFSILFMAMPVKNKSNNILGANDE